MAETENKVLQKDKKRLVKAQFAYIPANIDELQLKVNDILEVIEETEEGWWKGVLNGNIGMFPSNFVIELEEWIKVNESSPTKINTKMKNLDNQDKQDSIQYSITKPDAKPNNMSSHSENIIDALKDSESMDKKITFNKKNTETVAPRLPPKPVREQARVIYPYIAHNEDELSMKEGDIISVISKEVEDKGWWKGELNNRTGVFPDNFVQLIKVEEIKKPERPDKPSVARSSKPSLKSITAEVSPKSNKKVLKIPPAKPPPPEVNKKESERPSKKLQVPHSIKKPSRSSLGSNFQHFTSPHKSPETNSEKSEAEKNEITFEGVESSGKKLIHLTANRAKVPNRRPPSHIFLRETEDSSISSSDPRRLSEPLLSEMKSFLHLSDGDVQKTIEKEPPSRPSIKANKAGSVLLSKTISSDECIVKAPEPIKKPVDVLLPEVVPQLKKVDLHPSEFKPPPSSSDKELQELKENFKTLMASTVSKNEYNELLKQVKDLKESVVGVLEMVNELKSEIELEKAHRQTLEAELQQLKSQTTT